MVMSTSKSCFLVIVTNIHLSLLQTYTCHCYKHTCILNAHMYLECKKMTADRGRLNTLPDILFYMELYNFQVDVLLVIVQQII